MKKYILALLIALSVAFTGCASVNDVNLKQAEYNARIVEVQEQAKIEIAGWQAFERVGIAFMSSNVSDAGKTAVMMNSEHFAEAMKEQVKTQVSVARTGVDAQETGLEVAGQGLPVATVGVVAYRNAKEKGDIVVNSDGGDIIDTANTSRNQSLTTGDGNQTTTVSEKDKSEDTVTTTN